MVKYCSDTADVEIIITERLFFGVSDENLFFEYNGKAIKAPDFAVMRTIYPLLSSALERAGVRVFNNSETSRICNDKRLTHSALSFCGIPMMRSLFFDKRFFSSNAANALKYPLILKTARGHGGTQVYMIENSSSLSDTLQTVQDNEFLVQEVCDTVGRDLRVYIMGGKILCPILRTSSGFRSNYSLGGKAEVYTPNSDELATINRVLKQIKFKPDFIGLDFLKDGDRLIFNEIEDVVGTRMLYAAAGINAAKEYSDYISETNKKRRDVL